MAWYFYYHRIEFNHMHWHFLHTIYLLYAEFQCTDILFKMFTQQMIISSELSDDLTTSII